MTTEQVDEWLQAYIGAWRSYDPAAIASLFSDDAEYRYYPYEEPKRGPGEIVAAWLADRDDPDRWEAAYSAVAVDGDVAVATGSSVYTNPDGTMREAFDNCYVMRFDAAGRCREFTEYYVKRPKP